MKIQDVLMNDIEDVIKNFTPITGTRKQKSDTVKKLQEELQKHIFGSFQNCETEKYIFHDTKKYDDIHDRADVYAKKDDYEIIIEIDTTRADQISKKFVSRACYNLLPKKNGEKKKLIYVALLYQGTQSMNVDECIKYFMYCETILKQLSKDSIFIGAIIQNNNQSVVFYTSAASRNTIIEDLEIDAYTDYLRDECKFKEGSIDQYLRTLSKVHDCLVSDPKLTIRECINKLLNENKSNKDITSHLRKYNTWKFHNM